MLRKLQNPITEEYKAFKDLVLSIYFPWMWFPNATPNLEVDDAYSKIGIYYHTFLYRPDGPDSPGYPVQQSAHLPSAAKIVTNILDSNGVQLNCILRISANCVHAGKEVVDSPPHYDHDFEHKNLIVYLNDSDGDTFVEGERSVFEEDKAVLFSGKHYHRTPTDGRRIVLVATFI